MVVFLTSSVPASTTGSVHFDNARKAAMKGKDSKAIQELRISLQNNPLHTNSHYFLGYLLGRNNQIDQSIIGYQRALSLRPNDPDILYNLGTTLLNRGEFFAAAQMLEEVIEINPAFIEAYNNLAKAYFHLGLPELSIMAYSEAILRDPENVPARNGLALLTDSPAPKSETSTSGSPEAGSQKKEVNDAPEAKKKTEEAGEKGESSPGKDQGPKINLETEIQKLREILKDMPYLDVERRGGVIAVTGYTSNETQREFLTRILKNRPEVLDLTTDDIDDSKRMVEVDATLFSIIKLDEDDIGFNFLRMINMTFDVFALNQDKDGIGYIAPKSLGPASGISNNGWLATASVDYDVNIANAVDQQVALLARPHLTALSGATASFLAGGEIIFEVSGLNSGSIKPYPFGTSLKVTPTVLQTPGDTGKPRIHLVAEAGRTSVLSVLAASNEETQTSFTKIEVKSESVLELGDTLILSGLSQRETTTVNSGVPILRSIPVIRLFFSSRSTIDSELSVIILLTPRDPAYIDKETRESLNNFVQMRRDFVEALKDNDEGGDGLARFKKKYPDWYEITPNRLSSHIFMAQNSEGYQKFMGQDLSSEDLKFNLLSPNLEKR